MSEKISLDSSDSNYKNDSMKNNCENYCRQA